MYFQIIDHSNMKLYDMAKEMGGTLIARKVDCAVVHYDNVDIIMKNKPILKDSNEWGGHKNCYIPKITFSQEIYSKDYDLNIKDWKDYDMQDSDVWEKIMAILVNNGGFLLQADAGCGKTYVAQQMPMVLEQVQKPTN